VPTSSIATWMRWSCWSFLRKVRTRFLASSNGVRIGGSFARTPSPASSSTCIINRTKSRECIVGEFWFDERLSASNRESISRWN